MDLKTVPVIKILENHVDKCEKELEDLKYIVKLLSCLLGNTDVECSINLVMHDLMERCYNQAISLDEFNSLRRNRYFGHNF